MACGRLKAPLSSQVSVGYRCQIAIPPDFDACPPRHFDSILQEAVEQRTSHLVADSDRKFVLPIRMLDVQVLNGSGCIAQRGMEPPDLLNQLA